MRHYTDEDIKGMKDMIKMLVHTQSNILDFLSDILSHNELYSKRRAENLECIIKQNSEALTRWHIQRSNSWNEQVDNAMEILIKEYDMSDSPWCSLKGKLRPATCYDCNEESKRGENDGK
jgi:hypothetical protein